MKTISQQEIAEILQENHLTTDQIINLNIREQHDEELKLRTEMLYRRERGIISQERFKCFLFGLLLLTIFGGYAMISKKPENIAFKQYKEHLDSIYQFKMDSAIAHANRPTNDVLIHFAKDTLK